MDEELDALEKNQTWELTALPIGKNAIRSKWVYKVKVKADVNVERFKARLVAKGHDQIQGVDFHDSFSPVAKVVTVTIFFSIIAHQGWPLHQVDVNNDFLHGFLDEEIYMIPPQGYHKAKDGQVCKLRRSLYGLK